MFGTVPPAPFDGKITTTSYNLDDSEAVIVNSPSSLVIMYGYQFYSASPLKDTNHTITVTFTSVAAETQTEFWFDYLEYVSGGESALQSSEPAQTSSAPIPTTSSSSTASTSTMRSLAVQSSAAPIPTYALSAPEVRNSTGLSVFSQPPESKSTLENSAPSARVSGVTASGSNTVHSTISIATIIPAVLVPLLCVSILALVLLLWKLRRKRTRYTLHHQGSSRHEERGSEQFRPS